MKLSFPNLVLLFSTVSASDIKIARRGAKTPRALKDKNKGKVTPWQSLEAKHLAPIDKDTTEKEDEFRQKMNLPMRFAFPETVFISPSDTGVWEDSADGTVMWRYVFTCSDTCTTLSFDFSKFYLPDGAEVHIYDPITGATIGRTLSSNDNNEEKTLITPLVQTSGSVVVELDLQTKAQQELVELEITTVNNGYRGFERNDPNLENRALAAACNVDVVCPEGNAWRDEIRSVAHITINQEYLCSGAMLNNEKQDRKPYFLTAAHCGVTTNNAKTVVAYWNYEKSTCGGIRDGSTDFTTIGSTLLKTYTESDVTLLLLSEMPNPAYKVSYAGWDSAGAMATSSTGIHHPQGHEKSISFDFHPTTKITNYYASSGALSHIRVADWDIGVTEGGSSGSPLFDQNRRVIGQLHFGSSQCVSSGEASGDDGYGSFAWSFNQGGLRNYLAPSGTVTVMNTLAADDVQGPPPTNPTTKPPSDSCSDGTCGNCKTAHMGKGCICSSCQTKVCNQDSYCCQTAWDDICVDKAYDLCGSCATTTITTTLPTTTTTKATSTTTKATTTTTKATMTTTKATTTTTKATTTMTTITPPPSAGQCSGGSCGNCLNTFGDRAGCSCPVCETLVCGKDPYCCGTEWDGICVQKAFYLCRGKCGASSDDCLSKVCKLDWYCCKFEFDSICEDLESEVCD